MTRTARVHSIETVRDFRAHLCEFGTKARDTLSTVEMQIRRTFDWLDERYKYWVREIKVRQEDVTRAKIELEQRKSMNKQGSGPGTADHEKALRKAQARLKEAEDKAALCKKWKPILDHAVHEYYGPARGLSGALDSDLVKSLALLESKLNALEAYLALAPPIISEPLAPADASSESAAVQVQQTEAPKEIAPTTEEEGRQQVTEPSPTV